LHALEACYICLAHYQWPAGAHARRVCKKEFTGIYILSELVQGLHPEQGKGSTVEVQLLPIQTYMYHMMFPSPPISDVTKAPDYER